MSKTTLFHRFSPSPFGPPPEASSRQHRATRPTAGVGDSALVRHVAKRVEDGEFWEESWEYILMLLYVTVCDI